MTQPPATVRSYLSLIWHRSSNVHSRVTLILAVVIPICVYLFSLPMIVGYVVGALFAVLSVSAATYLVWRDLAANSAKPGSLDIAMRSVHLSAEAYANDVPADRRLVFTVGLDVLNMGDAQVALTDMAVSTFMMNTEVLGSDPQKTELCTRIPRVGRKDFPLPKLIQGGERLIDVEYRIFVELLESVPVKFARSLTSLGEYNLWLRYTYEIGDRSVTERHIDLSGSFQPFKERMLVLWKRNKKYQLICEALGFVTENAD